MHGIRNVFLLVTVLSAFLVPISTADNLTIGQLPGKYTIGDQVPISGTTDTRDIIAVYLLVAGPGLDQRGVCLENLNLPAGYGYFTSAHVNPDGTWTYEWDTGYLAGRLVPGTYTVYVVSLPLGLPHSREVSCAMTNVTFAKMPSPGLGMDLLPLCLAGVIGASVVIHCRKSR